jgi:hypothetical protein
MRGFIIGLILGLVVCVYGYEKGVLTVGSPGNINTEALRHAVPTITLSQRS